MSKSAGYDNSGDLVTPNITDAELSPVTEKRVGHSEGYPGVLSAHSMIAFRGIMQKGVFRRADFLSIFVLIV